MKNNQENKSEDLFKSKISNIMKVKVSDYKGKFRFTIPAEELRKIGAKVGDYLKVTLRHGNNKIEYYARIPSMPKSRTNLQVRRGIPKQFVEKTNIKKYDEVELQISLINNIKTNSLIVNNNYLDILAAIPEKTKSEKTIMADLIKKEDGQWCKFWYCSGHGGKAHEIELKRFIKIDKSLGEFFGLMQAESSKKGKMFDFTNKFMSEIKLFFEVSEKFGILKSYWSYVIYHRPNMKKEEIEKYVDNFSNELNTPRGLITRVSNRNLLEVIYNIRIPANILAEIMVSIMFKIRDFISNQYYLTPSLMEFAKGFIVKDLVGDGTVVMNNANKGLDIVISEQDVYAQKAIIKILKLFKINAKVHGIKIDVSSDFGSCLWFIENGAFIEHKENRKKLVQYILQNYYFNSLYSRIKNFKSSSIKEFDSKHNLSYNTAQMFLMRNKRRGYFNQIKSGIYEISQKGRDFIKIIEKAKKEITTLS